MKLSKYLYFIISFVFWMILIIYLHKTSGYRHVANLYATDPLSWTEIIDNIPKYIIGSTVMTIVMYYIYSVAKKNQMRKEEEARKRIEKRKQTQKEKNEKI